MKQACHGDASNVFVEYKLAVEDDTDIVQMNSIVSYDAITDDSDIRCKILFY